MQTIPKVRNVPLAEDHISLLNPLLDLVKPAKVSNASEILGNSVGYGSEGGGHRFESCRVRQSWAKDGTNPLCLSLFADVFDFA